MPRTRICSNERQPNKKALARSLVLKRILIATVVSALIVPLGGLSPGTAGATPPLNPKQAAPLSFPAPTWTDTIGPVALSSPTVTTLDGVPAVVFGSESGYVYAVNALTGANLPGWPEPVDIQPGVPTAVESSPTVAYLDGPKKPPSIIVGAGSTYIANQQGGVVAFNANGTMRFKFLTRAVFNEWANTSIPNGYRQSVFSTPAVGDLTGRGQLDIVFGSYDHRLYALTPNGDVVPGFPVDTEDTIWSSPALFHVRGPSKHADDIFIGGDASGHQGCVGGFVYDFTYVHNRPKIAWSHCEDQTIWSSPAVGVINSSGSPAVVVGTGFGWKPPYQPGTDRVYAFYAKTGRSVPGWPVQTAGPAFGSPAIGVLAGSTTPAVVDTSWCLACTPTNPGDSMVYAWQGTGKRIWSQTLLGPNDFSSPVIVDLTGSGGNDVVVGSSNGLYPLDGSTGAFLYGTDEASGVNVASMLNAVAVAYIPGSGPGAGWHLFEAAGGPQQVTPVGRLFDYPLPAVPGTRPPWPMWRGNPAHQGVAFLTIPRLLR